MIPDWDPKKAYDLAEKLYTHVRPLPSSQAMSVIAYNRDQMSSDFMRYVWDIVYCKVTARDKEVPF